MALRASKSGSGLVAISLTSLHVSPPVITVLRRIVDRFTTTWQYVAGASVIGWNAFFLLMK
ncbi:hypothetical protein [Chitinolyticbacter albus]|uniref:hypothetical protein n=1 Tax=Chitinolyticbacter albus TaxID=2961951 RepID=UPI00210BA704|nr:hypothetical protein [Chitinolyticbacter albus]